MPLRHPLSRLATVLLVLVLGLPAPAALAKQDDRHDNIVATSNTADGTREFAFELMVLEQQEGDIDHVNYAEAYASCRDCQAVAIAVQIVLVEEADSVTPVNLARSLNDGCERCDSLATAYQFVVDGKKLTKDGTRQVNAIRQQIAGLADDGLTGEQIQAQVDPLMTELGQLLETEVKGVDADGGKRCHRHHDRDED